MSSVLRFVLFLLSRRFVQAILWFIVALYGLDWFIYGLTQRQWFASIGYENLWLTRAWAQFELFSYFLLLSLVLTRLFLGSATKLSHEEAGPLRGALVRFEPLRHGTPRVAWIIAWICGLVLSRNFASHWGEWLFLQGTHRSNFVSYAGLPATLWTHVLPILAPFLWALWYFSLVLFLLVLVAGTLRALPLLAAREPAPPSVLPRVLWSLVAWLLGLRACLYVVQILGLNRGKPFETGDVFVSMPLFGVGAIVCLVLTFSTWWRARKVRAPQRWPKLASVVAAAIFLPGILNFLLAPLRAALPETAWLRQERARSTRAAWDLSLTQPVAQSTESQPTSTTAPWPIWDEPTALKAMSEVGFNKGRITSWKSVTFDFENGDWNALAAGVVASSEVWNASRDVNTVSPLAFDRLTFDKPDGTLERRPVPLPGYFGFEGRPLFANGSFGVPVGSFWSKWLWAWRQRDLFLPFDTGDDSRLLTVRGAKERAAELVPFWRVSGEPQLFLNGNSPVWMLNVCAVSSNFPGAMSAPSGELAGFNSASDSIKMLMNARTGAISFFTVPASPTPKSGEFLLRSWRDILPVNLKDTTKMPAALQPKWHASPAWLRAHLDLQESLAGHQGNRFVYEPSLGLNAQGKIVWRLLSVANKGWKTLEVPRGKNTAPLLRRTDGNFEARLSAIDVAVAKAIPKNDVTMGQPVAWSDAGAPGGWWIGRAFFSRPSEAPKAGETQGSGPTLWRVALTGVSGSKVEVNSTSRNLVPRYLGLLLPPQKVTPAAPSLETQALQAFEAAQKAAQTGGRDWVTFGRESARLKALLQKMASRRPVATPIPTTIPTPPPTTVPTVTPTASATPVLARTPVVTPTASAIRTPRPTPTGTFVPDFIGPPLFKPTPTPIP